MSRKIVYLFTACLLLSFIFGGFGIAVSAEPDAKQEALYKEALAFQGNGDYNNASEILKKLVEEKPGDSKYEISYLDTVLDQCIAMKESNSSAWKPISKDVGYKIKVLYPTQQSNTDYYLIYAKYSWLVEARREAHITKSLEKALYFSPNNPQTYILKGDIYSDMAKKADPSEKQDIAAGSYGGSGASTSPRQFCGMTAKASYEAALSIPSLDSNKKAYVYYKLGELKSQILKNKAEAKADWGKAVSAAAESTWGKLAKKRLEQ